MTAPARTPSRPPAPRPQPAAPRSYHFPHFEQRRLANGMRLVVAPVTKLPLVTAVALVEAGATPEPEVARLREERLAELLQQLAEPRGLADEQFSRALYDPRARYALPTDGTTHSVGGLTLDDVRAFYAARY